MKLALLLFALSPAALAQTPAPTPTAPPASQTPASQTPATPPPTAAPAPTATPAQPSVSLAPKPSAPPPPAKAEDHNGPAYKNPKSTLPKVAGIPHVLYSLKYIDLKVGTGPLAEPHKFYTVNYTGWFTDGTKFDSSYDHTPKEPITFPYGAQRVIIGWDTGFEGMRVGGKRRLYVPYQLAYGILGRAPKMGPKANLIFDLEFISQSDKPPASMMPPGRGGLPGRPPMQGGPGAQPHAPSAPNQPGMAPGTPASSAPATPPATPSAPVAPTPATPPPAAKPATPPSK